MGPLCSTTGMRSVRFPRVSGDEPAALDLSGGRVMFSPRERG